MSNSTAINETNDCSRMPSQRAFHIFRLAEIQGQTHKQIAELYKVTRRRISQIVERVRNWLARHPCEDPQIATALQAKRLGQHLEQMRLEDIDRARHKSSFRANRQRNGIEWSVHRPKWSRFRLLVELGGR